MSDLLQKIIKCGAVRSGVDVVLSSGVHSDIYIDCRMLFSRPTILKEIAQMLIKKTNLDYDVICGVPYGAVPLAACMSIMTGKRLIMLRKTPKKYGMKKLVEGLEDNCNSLRCLLVDDVLTSGASMRNAENALEENGVRVIASLVIFDRSQTPNRRQCLYTLDDVRECLAPKPPPLFKGVVMNASSSASMTELSLLALARSASCAVVTKTATLKPCDGNAGYIYHSDTFGSVNRVGLKNPGIKSFLEIFKTNKESFAEKLFIISIAGTKTELIEMVKMINAEKCSNLLFELNISCPNVDGTCHDIMIVREIIKLSRVSFGIKLPPLNPIQIQFIANLLNPLARKYDSPGVAYIVCCNTILGGLFNRESGNLIAGGIGGKYLKPLSLWNVAQFKKVLKPTIRIVGCGGVASEFDVKDYLAVGASAVQVGQFLIENRPQSLAALTGKKRCSL